MFEKSVTALRKSKHCLSAMGCALVLGFGAAACSNDDSEPSANANGGTAGVAGNAASAGVSGSGVSPTKTLVELTVAEDTLLCNWVTAQLGGYGYKRDCPNADTSYYAAPDLQTCLDSMVISCTATVADYERCMTAVTADPCNGKTIFGTTPCTGLSVCGTP